MPLVGGSWVSQTVRAQGIGFGYILMLFLAPAKGEFAQRAVKTSVVPGTAPTPVAQQQHG